MNVDSVESYRQPGESLNQTRARLRAVVDQADADALESVLSGIPGGAEFMDRAAVNWTTARAIGLNRQRHLDMYMNDDIRQLLVDYLSRLEWASIRRAS
ncbi:hypothetical protein [Scleromatobacter humisilvae]|uniref:Uncharacterized protein n=1 Tax=Scleromatobacter humisilvae TaxID=2897159 RepID=A0A9X1YIW2_9BURK|nr:hypothetical protein [Scleromatobacter humisilvae]MCK9687324.1 hypothetical protein [Scleromatobacter humisilvae]